MTKNLEDHSIKDGKIIKFKKEQKLFECEVCGEPLRNKNAICEKCTEENNNILLIDRVHR